MSFLKSSSGFASKIAHGTYTSSMPLLGSSRDLRPLQDLIVTEKTFLQSVQRLSNDLTRSGESLKAWGLGEGDDLGDVLAKAAQMIALVSGALGTLVSHEHTIRAHMKAIRTREERLDELRKRRRSVGSQAEAAEKKLSKMSNEHKNLPAQTDLLAGLREQMRALDTEILQDEASVSDFKRQAARNFMTMKFGGLLEFAEKATIVAELGKLLLEEIPQDKVMPGHARPFYQGHDKTSKVVTDAEHCVSEVVFTPPPESVAMAGRTSEDIGPGPMMQAWPVQVDHSRTGTERSEFLAPAPVAQDVDHPTEFGESGAPYSQRPAPMSQPVGVRAPDGVDANAIGGQQYGTYPTRQRREPVSFSASVQEALGQNPDFDAINLTGGTPPGPPPPPPQEQAQQAHQANPWDQNRSWDTRPVDPEERAMNAQAAQDISFELHGASASESGPPPAPQWAQPPGPPPQPPSLYATPMHSFGGSDTSSARTVPASAFRRRGMSPGAPGPISPVTDLERMPTLPAYEEPNYQDGESGQQQAFHAFDYSSYAPPMPPNGHDEHYSSSPVDPESGERREEYQHGQYPQEVQHQY